MNTNDTLIGQQLGNFLIQQPLGRGGMARVYKGLDLNLKRPVAVKVIEEGLRASGTYAQRFEREAQAVANLKHPNIVTVFHFGKHENLYFLVMEYLDGADLDAIIRNYEVTGELMPHADVIRILEAVASALDYAHTQGVIHRDVKPSNIMLERNGRPVLTDFGLALRVSEGTVGDTFGSPHYISPEQARNSANAVPQSDLYSLAVVAYELLAGVVPFDDPVATALAMQHILADVPSPRAFNRDLSMDVELVLFKALAKKPEDRYQTGAEFVAALRAAIEALKQNPVKVITADLPPLPPGVQPPAPRRLSMQTALDKLNQEVALSEARGQALTRYPQAAETESARTSGRGWLPYLIAVAVALGALAVVAVLLSSLLRNQAVPTVAVLPTGTSTDTPTAIVLPSSPDPRTETLDTSMIASPTLKATIVATTSPTDAPRPTSTPLPPSSTVALTLTPTLVPPSPTSIPTVVPPSPTTAPTVAPTQPPTPVPPSPPPPPTTAPTTPPTTAVPTVLYPDGRLFVLIWDTGAFYVSSHAAQRVASGNLSFERVMLDGSMGEQFSGGKWAQYYAYIEPNGCLVLRLPNAAFQTPKGECRGGVNADVNSVQKEVFWTAKDGSIEFRVLWKKSEVGRCQIAGGRCEIRFPPTG